MCRVSAVIGGHSIKIQKSSLMRGKSGHGERMGCPVKMEDARRKRRTLEKGHKGGILMENSGFDTTEVRDVNYPRLKSQACQ